MSELNRVIGKSFLTNLEKLVIRLDLCESEIRQTNKRIETN